MSISTSTTEEKSLILQFEDDIKKLSREDFEKKYNDFKNYELVRLGGWRSKDEKTEILYIVSIAHMAVLHIKRVIRFLSSPRCGLPEKEQMCEYFKDYLKNIKTNEIRILIQEPEAKKSKPKKKSEKNKTKSKKMNIDTIPTKTEQLTLAISAGVEAATPCHKKTSIVETTESLGQKYKVGDRVGRMVVTRVKETALTFKYDLLCQCGTTAKELCESSLKDRQTCGCGRSVFGRGDRKRPTDGSPMYKIGEEMGRGVVCAIEKTKINTWRYKRMNKDGKPGKWISENEFQRQERDSAIKHGKIIPDTIAAKASPVQVAPSANFPEPTPIPKNVKNLDLYTPPSIQSSIPQPTSFLKNIVNRFAKGWKAIIS